MPASDDAATLVILTFRVGPYLLGVEADQIAQLPHPAERHQPTCGTSDFTVTEMLDLRLACDLPPATKSQRSRLMMVERSGEMVGYRVDEIGDLITVEIVSQIWPLPPLLFVQKRWQQLWGVCQWEGELVPLVDLQYEPQDTPKEE